MPRFHAFLGAPTKSDLQKDSTSYHWQTISSTSPPSSQSSIILLPPATLDAASHRISLLYHNVIFDDRDNEQQMYGDDDSGIEDQTTAFTTWLPTAAQETLGSQKEPSFILPAPSVSRAQSFGDTFETQDTQSYEYSDASSIARFPSFHINLHTLTPLSSLSKSGINGSRKINVLLAVLELDGPDTITIKKGRDAGKEVAILKMILGDEEGCICKLTVWREVAEVWGGAVSSASPAAKRGDILLLENITAICDPSTTPTLTASPYLKSSLTICYRTMPYTHEDNRLRPDLRLGRSDVGVKKVAAVVQWFEGMAGLASTKE